MAYTLGEAAKATGKSKTTIAKAIKTGRVSAAKQDDGSYSIDPSELHRVYPLMGIQDSGPLQQDTPVHTEVDTELAAKVRELEGVLHATQQRLADKDEQLAHLREDRDREVGHLRKDLERWQQQAMQAQALLTDQRAKPPAGTTAPRRSWWPWGK